ncbi:MAG: hypothetical protein K2N06_08370 [Oscillospiraceae bacterium]|nr:hypothetical protein [Oscillospiraceae bacterium]
MKKLVAAEHFVVHKSPKYIYYAYPAIPRGIAGLIYLTQFHIITDKRTKYEKTIKDLGAAQLQRLRLFFVVKDHYIAFYRSRAPPSDLEVH